MTKPDSPTSKPEAQRTSSGVVTAFKTRRRKPLTGSGKNGAGSKETTESPAVSEKALQELKETIDQLPDINATKVVQLHQRIMAGDYVVDIDRLTDKLLALENALLEE